MRVRYIVAAASMLALYTGGTTAQAAAANDSAPGRASLEASSPYVPAEYSVFNAYSAFGAALAGPAGDIVARGYSIDSTAPQLLADDFLIGPDSHRYSVRDLEIVDRLTPDVDLEISYDAAMAGRFGAYDGRSSAAYDGLFLSASALVSPYAALTNGGSSVGSRVALSASVSVRFGEAILNPLHSAYGIPAFSYDAPIWASRLQIDPRWAQTSLAGVDWDFAPWGGLDLVATQTAERNGLLGNFNSGALSVAKSANTSAIGVSAHVAFGNGWVTTFSYNAGITQLSLKPNALAGSSSDTLQSRAYGFTIAKHGLFGDDNSLGFAISRPLQVYAGGVDMSVADGFDAADNWKTGRGFKSFSSATPETDLELGYVTTFMNGALALQANAGYQMNVPGLGGANSLSVISRAKINF